MKSNKRLKKLVKLYNEFYEANDFNLQPTVWNQDRDYIKDSFNLNFRGENAFVWQEKLGDNKETYIEYYRKIKSIDQDGLLNKTFECGNYGCLYYEHDGIKISRDLLDSVLEIIFLKSIFKDLDKLSILDIGAGYGRLCKRFLDCYPKTHYYITDAIPFSTYFSQIYLDKRKDNIIPLYDIENKLEEINFNIAINIHSFPECNLLDVEWWVKLINSNSIRYIFYISNDTEISSSGDSVTGIFENYGYKLKLFKNLYKELEIENYSYSVPFLIFENSNF